MIYLDNNSTTAIDPLVFERMKPYLTTWYGNAASVHDFGHRLMQVIDDARAEVGKLIGANPKDDITFTSGGTESNNTVFQALTRLFPEKRHIVTTAVEHSSVANPLLDLEMAGYEITRIPVDYGGALDLERFQKALRPETVFVTAMWANNETGVLFPVKAMVVLARAHGVLFHCDTVQAVGKVPVNVREVPVDYLSISAHKLHGPKGIGVLYARKGAPYLPLMRGGAQQEGRRPGTENVAGIAGTGEAARLARLFLENQAATEKLKALRDKLETGMGAKVHGAEVAGQKLPRIPNTASILFKDAEGEALLQMLSDEEIYASGGSACTAGTAEPSRVLLAMGYSERDALSAIRFSLSRFTTEVEIDRVLNIVPELVARLRALNAA